MPLYVTPSALVLAGVFAIVFAPVVRWLVPGVGSWGYLVALSLPTVFAVSSVE